MTIPSGTYVSDPHHASLTVRVRHQGFSNYTFRFDRFTIRVDLDAGDPAASTATARVDATSANTGLASFDAEIAEYLGSPGNSEALFRSNAVQALGADTARISGELSLNGRTHPITLDVALNRAGADMFGYPRLGLSATALLARSAFAVAPELSSEDVGEDVEIVLEVELTRAPA